jgi:hypothetical protein
VSCKKLSPYPAQTGAMCTGLPLFFLIELDHLCGTKGTLTFPQQNPVLQWQVHMFKIKYYRECMSGMVLNRHKQGRNLASHYTACYCVIKKPKVMTNHSYDKQGTRTKTGCHSKLFCKKIRKKERLKAKNTDSFWGQRDGSKRPEAL